MNKFVSILFVISACFLVSCRNSEGKAESDMYYTCSMDPQVVEYKPGSCPICKMPLTPVRKDKKQEPGVLELSDQQLMLGNITTDTVRLHPLGASVLLSARTTINQDDVTAVSARVMGRVEKLYFKNTGEKVNKGQALYTLYSEELNIAIRELLLAVEKKKSLDGGGTDPDRIISSARKKLELFGLTESQVRQIEENNKMTNTIEILSPASGIITSVDVKEGNYLMSGEQVMTLADLSSIWIEAEIYPADFRKVKAGAIAEIRFPGLPGRRAQGMVSFVNPQLNPSSKVNLVRVELKNPGSELLPGMQADVSVLLKELSAPAVPTDAVILDGQGATVWIKLRDNKFKNVMVETGIESNGYTEIRSGLSPGQEVVVTGAYLLHSEFILKKGVNPMEGHEM